MWTWMAESRSVVIAALIANGAIAVMKFVGFTITGSPAMLSETYHSISDTGNQVFLLIGLRFGERGRSAKHPFGTGKAEFFYSFLVAVLLFGIAGWESARHGWHAITHPTVRGPGEAAVLGFSFPGIWVNYAVLVGAIAFEAWAFKKAYAGMQAEMDAHGWQSIRETFSKTTNTVTLTAFTEDALAGFGAGLALFGIWLSRVTGNPLYDAVASFLIGLLLMGFALVLAWENKRLLLGEGFFAEDQRELRSIITETEGVVDVVDLRSVYFGPEDALVTASVEFEDGMTTGEIESRVAALEERIMAWDADINTVFIQPAS